MQRLAALGCAGLPAAKEIASRRLENNLFCCANEFEAAPPRLCIDGMKKLVVVTRATNIATEISYSSLAMTETLHDALGCMNALVGFS